jgi:HEAT repeat protein
MRNFIGIVAGCCLAAALGTGTGFAATLPERLVSADEQVRDSADSELGGLDEAAKAKLVPALTTALKSKDAAVRYYAAKAIGEIGPGAKSAIPVLIKMLNDTGLDSNVGLAATDAFGRIGPEAIPYLMKALKDKDNETRSNAASALGDFGPAAKAAVPLLIEAANGKYMGLRQSSVRALGRIGPDAKAAVPALAAALKDKNALLQSHAAEALENIGTPEALKVIEAFKKSQPKE